MTCVICSRRALSCLTIVTLVTLGTAVLAEEHPFAGPLSEVAEGLLRDIAEDPEIVAAIHAQNAVTAGYDQSQIDALDLQWRAELGVDDKPLIEATLGSEVSAVLAGIQDQSAGLITELFVMDARGLNVAQSTVTSDYWQGDEDKFSKSFGIGPGAVHLGEIGEDESTQMLQSQVSITIVDPETKVAIGAVTAGVNLSMIQ